MKIIAVLNQKGGCGKTTISINLAHSFQNKGYRTLLVDNDPQGSARDWNQLNDGKILNVVGLDRDSLANDIKAVRSGYDYIIIDGAPSARLSTAAITVADLVLIPVQPSPYDIWATDSLVQVVKARQEIMNNKPMVAFVVSRAIKNTKIAQEIIVALTEYNLPILCSFTTNRIIYSETAAEGLTVYSRFPVSDVTVEIDNIASEIIGLLNGIMCKN